jgi:hypothetical protein
MKTACGFRGMLGGACRTVAADIDSGDDGRIRRKQNLDTYGATKRPDGATPTADRARKKEAEEREEPGLLPAASRRNRTSSRAAEAEATSRPTHR